jgi:ATP-dependent DNA ligase
VARRRAYFPDICHRVLNRDTTIPITFVVFDVLAVDGTDMTSAPFRQRRAELAHLALDGPGWPTSETFEDGEGLFRAVCERDLEGVVAKRLDGRYGPRRRGWVKTKNPNYWRRDLEREAMACAGAASEPRRALRLRTLAARALSANRVGTRFLRSSQSRVRTG